MVWVGGLELGARPYSGGGRHDAYTGYEYYGSKGASWHLEVQEADVFFSAGCW